MKNSYNKTSQMH